jgi:hypothetical protein
MNMPSWSKQWSAFLHNILALTVSTKFIATNSDNTPSLISWLGTPEFQGKVMYKLSID